MRTLLLRPEDAARGPLILVRRGCPLRERPGKPELMPAVRGSGQLLRREAARELRRLTEAAGLGEELVAVSGYRTGEEQARLFSETERERGAAFTNAFVARPGCSEHESGYAIDLAGRRERIDPICPELPRDGAFARLRALMPYFGFVERYPAGKEAVTGIGAEPWHFRYLGPLHALVLTGMELTLEEYLEKLAAHRSWERALVAPCGSGEAEICTFEVGSGREVPLPEGICLSSGTNTGLVALARWRRYGR